MSPTVLRVREYRFFFFSREEARPHVHVETAEGEAKVWLNAYGKEYFLDFDSYPWFKEKEAHQVQAVEARGKNIRWPALDIDLSIDSLENPHHYPLKSKA